MLPPPAEIAVLLRPIHRLLDGALGAGVEAPAGDCYVDPARDTPFPSSSGNQLRGLGSAAAPTAEQVREWVARYRQAGMQRCFAAIHPGPFAAAAAEVLAAHGFTPFKGTSYPTLARRLDDLPHATCPFSITVHARQPPTAVAPALDQLYGDAKWRKACTIPGVTWVLASAAQQVVAATMLLQVQECAYLSHAQTLESHRRQGAQRALIATRLALARDAGCTIALVETLARCKESLRNLRHSGFVESYAKQVLVLTLT